MIQVSDVDVLNNLQPNMDAISDVTHKLDAVSFHVFALADDEYTAHVRDFAPLYGVPEESATGTANAALAHYLLKHGVVDNPCECSFLQGTAMGRPSVVAARIAADGNIYIGGSASVVAEGCLLPNIRNRI
jgi:PhzF family phenazine biosynthesis protein